MYERTSPRGVIASFHYLEANPIQQREWIKKEKIGASPIQLKKRKEIKEIGNLSMYSIVFMSMMFSLYDMQQFYARSIGMHMCFHGQEYMHISIDWLHNLKALSFNVHGCLHYSELESVITFSKQPNYHLFISRDMLVSQSHTQVHA